VTHEEALDVLTTWIVAGRQGNPTPRAARAAAEEHVARCRNCWIELRATHGLLTGAPLDAVDRMGSLFGCEKTQAKLYLLVGLEPASIAKQHPDLAQHLAWCHVCREDLAELVEMQQVVDEQATVPARTPSSERVAEALYRLAVVVGEGLARFSELPARLVAVPIPAPAGAWRSDSNAGQRLSGGEHVTLDLGDSGLQVTVTIEPQESGRLRLSLSLTGRSVGSIDVTLRQIQGPNEPILAAQTTLTNNPFVVGGLVPGRYVLEINETPDSEHHRVELAVEAKC
jgi:hypothetical protein